ncbi:MAG TPA: toluene-4-monooxygenase system B family protein [Polyangiaceae bacterium]|nr:toluene-4-monooxygenase system B family protein [Polyangiaceae bacterium]
MIPLYGFLQGDTIGTLVLAEDDDTAQILADKVQASARLRVPTSPRVRLLYRGHAVDLDATVLQLGIQALERIDVVRETP